MSVETFISEEDIAKRITELGESISKDFDGDELIVVGILNGGFVFCADLIRKINAPMIVDFFRASSYGEGTESSGNLEIISDLSINIEGKDVLIVEDIVDTGLTLTKVIELFKSRSPKSVKLASLLYKPSRNLHKVPIDYLGFEIEDKFVIGYGLDYAGKYRELPYIGVYQGD